MKKFIKNVNWKRVLPLLIGTGGIVDSLGGAIPPWLAALSGVIAGAAINAERIVAKRETPSNPFDSVDAAEKVEKMK